MKKVFLLIAIFFTVGTLSAETGKEAIGACAAAMNSAKLTEFKTMKISAYMYQQGQKVSLKLFNKDEKVRFEQSVMGQTSVYVLADDEFFQLKPSFEMLQIEDVAPIMQIVQMVLPAMMIPDTSKLDETQTVIELLGTEEYNSKTCKKIKIAPKESSEGAEQIIYTDAITNWLVGVKMGSMGLNFESMKKIKGFVYPSVVKLVNASGNKLGEIEIDKIEADIELEDSLFSKN